MSKPRTANPALAISEADLASALAQIGTEVDDQPLRSSALARIMRETFHGSDAGGAWDWRIAYDMMQAAAVQVVLRGNGVADDIAAAKLLASRLLTETRRSEQQIRLQQFSTPLPFAALVLRAAAIRKGETVLEPSAGTGALAAFAARAGATLLLNEIDPFRQRLLRAVFGGDVTGHDGEHIDDLLQTPVLPDVVVMNPPFASSVDRSRDKHIAAKHLIAAAKRLAPGGRLVAIMPPGFPSRESFVSAMEAGGVAAMEVVARDLKTLGLYTARALSFDGVEYDVLEHALTPAQIEIYDAYAGAFRTIHHNLEAALTATGVNDASGETNASAARASAKSRFESTKQRFFNHLLMGMKAPSIIRAIADDLAAGNACVIQVVSTGESLLKRRLEAMDPEDELVEGALTPRDYVLGYLEQAFPIHAQKLVEIDGNMVAEPLRDETGALVVSREALALRDAAMMELMTLAPIPSALDQILWAFGDEAVAEVTGRSIRPLKAEDGHLFIEKRAASSNSSETQAFMDGEKDILIFSDAGGTGRSYHAAQTAKNQKRRRHYLLEPGWRADAAIQGLGRTHRSAQISAPFFRVCTSDVHGEKRFTSTIAKRLDQLGALTKGQRETGSQGMFREEDNLESPIARAALRGYFADLAAGRAEAMSYESFTDWTALRLIDKDGVLLEELPPIQRFLNRVLALPIHMQNALFAEFMRRIADQTERARAAGTLDLGVETLRGNKIEQVSTEDLWTCPKSGAVTRIIGLEVTDPVHVLSADDALSRNPDKLPMVNRASGRAALISARPMQMYDEDIVTLMRKVVRPNGSSYLEEARFESSAWEDIERREFSQLWDAEAASLPKTTTTKLYLLTGLLLPIWKDIPTTNERIYRVTPDGATAMIGRTLSEEGAAALRARFLVSNPQTPQEMLTAALGTTAPVELGRGLTLTRRRVAGEMRLELGGADRGMIDGLKAMGCFTEIIAFQLRVFLPHGDGIDTGTILARIVGQEAAMTSEQAA